MKFEKCINGNFKNKHVETKERTVDLVPSG